MPTTEVLQYRAGSIIVFTKGEYSNFHINSFLVATKDLDLPKLAQTMTKDKSEDDDSVRPDNFAAWLISSGYAMPVDYSEVHVADYSEWEPEFGVKYKEEE